MKKRLFIADVHANFPALQAVLDNVRDADEIVFLGDIVGYGPHPAQCIDALLSLNPAAVKGNHDLKILSLDNRRKRISKHPVNWDEWTYMQLAGKHLSYIGNLPDEIEVNSCNTRSKVLHRPPESPYLHPDMGDGEIGRYFKNFREDMVIFGHSHYAISRYIRDTRIVCVPSVGQPRDGSPRAGYAIEAEGEIKFYAVDYDVEKTVHDTIKIGLPAYFTRRWINFVRTGYDPEWSREPAE